MVPPRPAELRSPPPNPLTELFPAEVIEGWKRKPTLELAERWTILEAEGFYPERSGIASTVRGLRAKKAAWEAYLIVAFACGMFEGVKGNDLRRRLQSRDAANFRSALAECLACWFLAAKHRLRINTAAPGRGAKNLEMIAFWNEVTFAVEVKAPYRAKPYDGVGRGDGSDKIEDAIVAANKQFDNKGPNLLVLVPDLPIAMHTRRQSLMHALYGRRKITFPVNPATGTRCGPTAVTFFAEGKLFNTTQPNGRPLKPDGLPAHQRISAVLCLEEYYVERYPSPILAEGPRALSPNWPEAQELHDSPANLIWAEHRALVLHNPFALHPFPHEIFASYPQCVPVGPAMRWTDGHDTIV